MPNVINFRPTGQAYVDGILSGTKWATTSLTFSFPDLGSHYGALYGDGETSSGFARLSSVQQSFVRDVLDVFESVSKLNFSEIAETSAQHADIRFAESSLGGTAWAYMPSPAPEGGDVWLNGSNGYYDSPEKGNYAYATLLHEVGHALGLKHSHDQEGLFATMPNSHDSIEYTVMSYCSYVGSTERGYCNEEWGFGQSLMMDDIAALQHMYGADYTTNSGNSTYKWSPSTGQMFINGSGQGAPGGNQIFLTVWDGGGVDTYDLSNYGSNVNINLAPGGWTTTSAAQLAKLHWDGSKVAAGNIANARLHQGDGRSLIENAIGGSGDDRIVGNTAKNTLRGGEGNDVLTGGANQDFLWGGSGADVFNFDALSQSGVGAYARDLIRDFNAAVDRIDLLSLDADQDGTSGNQAFKFIGSNAFGGVDGQLRFGWLNYEGTASDRTIVSADVNGDRTADVQISLAGLHSLSGNDFLL
jgi:serralysin